MTASRAASARRWQRRKEDRPGEILQAALACFAERGFAATRLEDVAHRAGVTKGTLYLYFASKEELFKAAVRQTIVPNIAQAEALVADWKEPGPALLGRVLHQWLMLRASPASALPKLVLSEAGNFPDLARFYLSEVVDRGTRLIRRLLHKGIERGEFRPIDVDNAVFCIVGPMLLSMLWRHSFERHGSPAIDGEALWRAHLDLLSHGLVPADSAGKSPPASHGMRRTGP